MTRKASTPDVGQRLAAARMQRGLAQGVLAKRAGLAPSYLSRVENGKVHPTFRTVMHIVRTLGMDLSEVIGSDASAGRAHGPCPVTAKGQCLMDLMRAAQDPEHYTPREIRLLRRFAKWIKSARPDRVRAIEVLLDDLLHAVEEGSA